MPLDMVFEQVNLAISLVNEWTMDVIDQLPKHYENREKLLQLQHRHLSVQVDKSPVVHDFRAS